MPGVQHQNGIKAPLLAPPERSSEPLASMRAFWAQWQRPHPISQNKNEQSALITGLVAVLLFGGLLALVGVSVDARVAKIVQQTGETSPLVIKIFQWITAIGLSGYMLWGSAAIALIAVMVRQKAGTLRLRAGLGALATRATCFFAIIAISGILAQVLKHMVGRGRPKLIEQFGAFHFDVFSWKASLASFPSGHTTTAFAAATALAFFAPRWQGFLFVIAGLVGLSRVVVGAHYPTDVLGGMMLGMVSAIVVARAFARRDIGFYVVDGRLRRRGEGLVGPAVRALLRGKIAG